MERPKPKTFAERQLEREEAVQRLQEQIAGGGERPCTITSADIPDQVARPRPSKPFIIIGLSIIVILIVAQCILSLTRSSPAKASPKPEPAEAVETE